MKMFQGVLTLTVAETTVGIVLHLPVSIYTSLTKDDEKCFGKLYFIFTI